MALCGKSNFLPRQKGPASVSKEQLLLGHLGYHPVSGGRDQVTGTAKAMAGRALGTYAVLEGRWSGYHTW